MAKLFTELLDEASKLGIIPAQTQKARDWFRGKAEEVVVSNTGRVIATNPIRTNKTIVGHMYLFSYVAITNLPYYDRYPLIFPFRVTTNGFYGINLHYLPLEYRAILMDNLYNLATDNRYDEKTRLKLTYDILNGVGKFRFFRPCVKQYLNIQVQTKFALIPAQQWDIALFLPIQKFVKSAGGNVQTEKVYRDSVKQIRRGK